MEKLGNCIYKPTSKSCANDAFCPLPNPTNNSLCRPCAELLPGSFCNCQMNLRLNCASCDGIQCASCISGYILQNGNCILQNFCENGSETCAHGSFCPIGVGQRNCQNCDQISSDQECHCAGVMLKACKSCQGTQCTSCLSGHQLVTGKCFKQDNFGGCTSSSGCQFGTFCSKNKCVSCSSLGSGDSCNCGELIKGCKVCGENDTCLECTPGLLFSKGGTSDGYSFPNRGCQNPGKCKGNSSYDCSVNFYCDLTDNKCLPCDNKIIKPQGCFCGIQQQIFYLNTCDLVSKQGKICFPGYLLKNLPEVGYTCYANYCEQADNYCQNGYFCPENPIGTTTCLTCTDTSTMPCQCFYQENCKTCNITTEKCDLCLNGFVKNAQGMCVPKTNICGKQGTSLTCDNQHVCQGQIGDECVSCSEIQMNQSCNCKQKLAENCIECNESKCSKCRDEYILENGKCIPNMCGSPMNTKNCYIGYYCPNIGSSAQTICKACDTQQQDCNCGLLTGCQTCGTSPNTCGNCFDGYEKDPNSSKCELKSNICDYSNGSTICTSGSFCNGKFGDQCIPCSTISLGQFCKCGSTLAENCLACTNNQCSQCLPGYFPVNGQCFSNICNSGSSSSTCAFGNFCPPGDGAQVECHICDGNNTVPCQCGANNCITCGTSYNSCKTCIFGYDLDPQNQCILKNNICDSINSSSLCQTNFYCNNTFGNPCISCQKITPNQSCNCDQIFQQNCMSCSGKNCFKCLTGFLTLENGTCAQNSCDEKLSSSTCHYHYQCNPNSAIGDNCQSCSPEIESQCSCGTALNCKTCGTLLNTCEICLYGYTFNQQTLQCVEITDATKNICDKENSSLRCDNQYFCSGEYGDSCQFCSALTPGKLCNCSGFLQQNCVFCEAQECKFCIPGYYLDGGKCVVNKCGPEIPVKCVDGFFCPETTKETVCEQCSTQEIQCNCGNASFCQICALQNNQCLSCLKGYSLTNGQCQEQLKCVSAEDCYLGEYCFQNKCEKCGIQVVACNCGIGQNCQVCGPSGTCQSCLDGWAPNSSNTCVVPICVDEIPLGQFCEEPDKTGPCPEKQSEIDEMYNQCNCGQAQNCANCIEGNTACKTCMNGSIMINGVCFVKTPGFTGECRESGDSIFCMSGYACIAPEVCSSCEGVSTGYSCNCDANLIMNCIQCDGNKCGECFTGFIQVNGECIPACYGNDDCLIGQMCGQNVTICSACDGSMICNCGNFEKCTSCDENTCFTCTEGYKVGFKGDCNQCDEGWIMNEENPGECIVGGPKENKTLDLINYIGIGVGVASVVGMGIGISVFYAKRPKKHSLQHNFMPDKKLKKEELEESVVDE